MYTQGIINIFGDWTFWKEFEYTYWITAIVFAPEDITFALPLTWWACLIMQYIGV